ncbi:MAG: hypothetical protein IKG18_09695 [Atopobiaceae bacterium]|nr:hypothetical protein [Atopobiaceae bacterium]
MGLFFVSEKYSLTHTGKHTAIGKAREDVEHILTDCGCGPIDVVQNIPDVEKGSSAVLKLKRRVFSAGDWKKSLKSLVPGDVVFIQFPVHNHSIAVSKYLASLAKGGVRIVLVVHDLESFRIIHNDKESRLRRLELQREEGLMLDACAGIIFHNTRMQERAKDLFGPQVYDKSISLGCFDYLLEGDVARAVEGRSYHSKSDGVIIAGNLLRYKAGYAYELPDDVPFLLYGPNYVEGDSKPNVTYQGVFAPDELPMHLDGSFGLIWDGPTADTCAGAYGEYLEINNPHKASLYLASGLPVIIWERAALAELVEEQGCGLTVASLSEIGERLAALDEGKYREMAANARVLGAKLRKGWFMTEAVYHTLAKLCPEES